MVASHLAAGLHQQAAVRAALVADVALGAHAGQVATVHAHLAGSAVLAADLYQVLTVAADLVVVPYSHWVSGGGTRSGANPGNSTGVSVGVIGRGNRAGVVAGSAVLAGIGCTTAAGERRPPLLNSVGVPGPRGYVGVEDRFYSPVWAKPAGVGQTLSRAAGTPLCPKIIPCPMAARKIAWLARVCAQEPVRRLKFRPNCSWVRPGLQRRYPSWP